MNLVEFAEESYRRLGERVTTIFDGQKYTNSQILEKAKQLHCGFARLGLRKGQFAVLCLVNNPMIFPVFQGIFRAGGCAVPVMSTLSARELRYIFEDAKALGCITDKQNVSKVHEAARGLDHMKWIVIVGGEDNSDVCPLEYGLDTLMKNDSVMTLPKIDEDDLAILLYTSGTTGKPKGAMLTHRNLVSASENGTSLFFPSKHKFKKGRWVLVNFLPMAHIFGLNVANLSSLAPEYLEDVYIVHMSAFDPVKFMELITEHKATIITVVPTVMAMLLYHPRSHEFDMTSLEHVISGGAPLSPEMNLLFAKWAGVKHISQAYGSTECTGLCSYYDNTDTYRPGSVGKAYRDVEISILDDDDNVLPTRAVGEIAVKSSKLLMKGYLNRPKETAEALRNGWLHTGDVGYMDEDSWLYIMDRKKDMIIRGGENIYPAELEAILYECGDVAEAAIVGKPDPVYGENVVAFIVAKKNSSLCGKDIIDFVKARTAPFKAPSEVYFVDMLPKTSTGKILKRELRDSFLK